MKKILSGVLSFLLILSVLAVPVSAGTVDELDNTGNSTVLFNFEDDGLRMILNGSKAVWNKDLTHSLSYFPTSWSAGGVVNNPVKVKGSDKESIVNSSDKSWAYAKYNLDRWVTGGGNVLHINTANGPEPVILQNNVTYKLSFDYMVSSTHRTDEFADSNGNVGKINPGATDLMKIGYGYQLTTTSWLHPLYEATNNLDTVISYSEQKNGTNGTYTGDHSKTRKTGNWYHTEYVFTPTNLVDIDFSKEGTTEAVKNNPFIIIYKNAFSGTCMHMDNIKLSTKINGSVNAMGGTAVTKKFSGFAGDVLNIENPLRYGYEFDGWYLDGARKNKFNSSVFTGDLYNSYIYAGWNDEITGFESYAPLSASSNGSRFAVTSEKAFSGKKSMKYHYEYNSAGRTADDNLFTVKPIESNKKYKITFKYLSNGKSLKVYPVTMGSSYTDHYKAYSNSYLQLNPTSNQWVQKGLILTVHDITGGKNLGLHVEAINDGNTNCYIDDIVVKEYTGKGTLTVNAGSGTVDGVNSKTFDLDYGTKLCFEGLKLQNKSVEGFYYDSAFTDRCPNNAFTAELNGKTLFVKWSDTQGFEHYSYDKGKMLNNGFEITKNFAKSGAASLLMDIKAFHNLGRTAFAALSDIKSAGDYLLEFYYYAPLNNSCEVKPVLLNKENGNIINENPEGFVLTGNSKGWKKAALLLNGRDVSANNILALGVKPTESTDVKIYFDDIKITELNSKKCVIFDTLKADGQRVAVCGNSGEKITVPSDPYALDMRFEGWYLDSKFEKAFSENVFSDNKTVFARMDKTFIKPVKGDIDSDGFINAKDLALLKRYIAGFDVRVSIGADLDSNGSINAVDLLLLKKKIAF